MSQRRRDQAARFNERYSQRATEAGLAVEREAIGANVGANGYTTVRQADLLAERLVLTADTTLLDLGCGRGWPGLYLAERTGCRVVLTDIPEAALRTALRAADRKGISGQVDIVQASATQLAFRPRTFDAICHSDVL